MESILLYESETWTVAAASNIGRIRRYLDKKSTIILTHAFVTSRLDNFNSLLGNITQKDTSRLQRIQNISTRITARTNRTASTSPILQSLHWLPVDKRIKFKLFLITYKALHGLAPTYISELLQWYQQRRRTLQLQLSSTFFFKFLLLAHSSMVPGLLSSLHPHCNALLLNLTRPTGYGFKFTDKQKKKMKKKWGENEK